MNLPSLGEAGVRIGCFAGVLLVMTIWELLAPRRALTVRKSPRWFSNLGLVAFNGVLVRLVVPLSALGTAELTRDRGWGLLNQWPVPVWVRFVVAVAALDFAI